MDNSIPKIEVISCHYFNCGNCSLKKNSLENLSFGCSCYWAGKSECEDFKEKEQKNYIE